jgi:hypothetical protein
MKFSFWNRLLNYYNQKNELANISSDFRQLAAVKQMIRYRGGGQKGKRAGREEGKKEIGEYKHTLILFHYF